MAKNSIPVLIPLVNPNEPEALLVSVEIQEGQRVSRGDTLCILETTKSTSELVSESDGYITGLQYTTGDTVSAGDIFCHLSDSPQVAPQEIKKSTHSPGQASQFDHEDQGVLPSGLRISQPALTLARQHNLDLNRLPTNAFITESYIRKLIQGSLPLTVSPGEFDPTKIIIYGGGGHGKTLIEMIRSLGYLQIQGIIDDGLMKGTSILDVPVLGGEDVLSNVYQQGIRLAVNAVGGIGNIQSRVDVFLRLAGSGFQFPILIHPSAVVESSAYLSPGIQAFSHAYIGSDTHLGFGTIINTNAVISHDCSIGDYTNISPGALIAGGVQIGDRCLIGMGVTINLGVTVGPGARIVNSTTIKADVPPGHIIRAGTIWPE
jgi:sugar O-acyltransferase (sialic acid O-acetyltransferase NeuD family)